MTKQELIEENSALRQALESIVDQIDDVLGVEAEEGFDESEK